MESSGFIVGLVIFLVSLLCAIVGIYGYRRAAKGEPDWGLVFIYGFGGGVAFGIWPLVAFLYYLFS